MMGSHHQKFSSRFGGGIGISRIEWGFLGPGGVALTGQLTIDLICRDVNQLFHLVFDTSIDNDLGAQDIGSDERVRVRKRIVNEAFCRPMNDDIWSFKLKDSINDMLITNIS